MECAEPDWSNTDRCKTLRYRGYSEGIAEELPWNANHDSRKRDAYFADFEGGATEIGGETYVNPLRHVGRNDPCPCDRGKKAKRCCLVG